MSNSEKNNPEKNDPELQELSRRLRSRRLFLDLTYQQLAEKTGMSKSTLQRYESGSIKNLPYKKIPILSEALEVSPSYFTDLCQDYTSLSVESSNGFLLSARNNIIEYHKNFENDAINRLTPRLIQNGYTVEKQPHGSLGDLVAKQGKEIWYIDFRFVSDTIKYPTGTGMQTQDFFMRMGRLATYQGHVTKYSLLLNHRAIGSQLVDRFKKIKLNVNLSIIFLTKDGYEEIYFEN